MNRQIIVAMDNEIPDGLNIMRNTCDHPGIYGYKLGSLWVVQRGINILEYCKEHFSGKKIILDMQKWGTDIPEIVTKQVNLVAPYVDELIVCPMGGGKQSLKAFADACLNNGIKPICVLEMTHPDSDYFLVRNSMVYIMERACEFGIEKFVIPATKQPIKDYLTILNRNYPNGFTETVDFYATGFKAQGGQTKPMVDFGVTKFIMGRAIYDNPNPIEAVDKAYEEITSLEL